MFNNLRDTAHTKKLHPGINVTYLHPLVSAAKLWVPILAPISKIIYIFDSNLVWRMQLMIITG